MAKYSIILTPEHGDGVLTYSKNYRILTLDEGITGMRDVSGITDIVHLGSAQEQYLQKYLRYSLDKVSWSMWLSYQYGMDMVRTVVTDPKIEMYFQFKYEYNDGTTDPLAQPLSVSQITLTVDYDQAPPTDPQCAPKVDNDYRRYTLMCHNEMCPLIAFDRKSVLNPYDVGPAIGLYTDMSFYVNNIFGIDTLYFRAEPDRASADFIFKEWTLYKVMDRKCCKILIPGNKFPDNKWLFNQVGETYDEPFEIHIDKNYFETIFGPNAEPRMNDFLYFPLLDRMFELKGAYLYRGFMMKPIYWKASMTIFKPNINLEMSGETRMFLENTTLDAGKLFAEMVADEVADARMPQQYETKQKHYDKVRHYINKTLAVRNSKFYFNYADLISYYYDLSTVNPMESAVEYNSRPVFGGAMPNVSYSSMISIPATGSFTLLNGRDEADANGLKVTGTLASNGNLTVTVYLNGNKYPFVVPSVSTQHWYCVMLSMSTQYKQVGIHFYDMPTDPADIYNHNNMVLMASQITQLLPGSEFCLDKELYLFKGSAVSVACVRVFNRLIAEEKQTFVLSQQFLKEESMLQLIDNCVPRIDAPFVTRNR